MIVNANSIPESWLTLLGGRDASGWLAAFVASPKKAVADLLWDAFYFGPLNLTERGQLLAGWLDLLGNSEQFAERLDAELTGWVEENWGRFDHSAGSLASAWSCLCSLVEFSSKLPDDSRLKNCAAALRARFAERQRLLGSFSTAPAADPVGVYLAVVAEFQEEDRSLAAFWHRTCDLPDGVPFYHARYAMLGLRRLKAADPSENGSLRVEVVLGLLRLARAFDRLVRERGLPEDIAKTTFRRVAAQTAAAYPGSQRWREHGLSETLELPERARRWLLDAVPPLAEAVRRVKNKTKQHQPPLRNSSWAQKARELAARLKSGDQDCLSNVKHLLDEQRRYAEATGDTYFVVRSLCQFASRVLSFSSKIALRWAEEARRWEPDNAFTWATIKDVLLRQRMAALALRFGWVAWKRFPENVVIHSGLAEVLKAVGRYDEAGAVYRQTIKRFPEDVVARTGLAEVLKAVGHYDEAEAIYRQTIVDFPSNIFARGGLADTLRRSGRLKDAEIEYRGSIDLGLVDYATLVGLACLVLRKGEAGRVEALDLMRQALELDPRNRYTLQLKQRLLPESGANLDDLTHEWDNVADALFEAPTFAGNGEELESEEAIRSSDTDELEASVQQPVIPEDRRPDSLEVAALVAEAYFYRTWANGADDETARARRQNAAKLIGEAEQLAPQDPQVLAERAALTVDEGNESEAYQNLTIQVENHPAVVGLLVLKARLDRERAQKEGRPLNDTTLTELCAIPQRLHDLNPALAPLFHFQKGLASLALLDGAIRGETAARSFSSFRSTMAQRASEEKKDREHAHDRRSRDVPRIHEWLEQQTNRRFFAALAEPVDVHPADIPGIENALVRHRAEVMEVEDVFADRLAFSTI